MAGIFGTQINDRKEFFEQLSSATRTCSALSKRHPEERLLGVVGKQLDAIRNWTERDRTPSKEERKSIVMGIQMFREYETTGDEALRALTGVIGSLNNYFLHWPDDKAAADPANGEHLSLADILYDDDDEASS